MGFVVFANDLTFGDVFKLITTNFDFNGHPPVAMESGALGVDDVRLCQLTVPMKVGAGCADIKCSTVPFAEAAEELHFNRVWKVLVFLDGLGILAMEHEAVVTIGLAWAAGDLLADEAVGPPDFVIRVGSFVIKVSKLTIKLLPL